MDSNLEREVITEIAAGESYIVQPPIKGKICVWVNCDREMQIKLTTDDFRKAAVSLFKHTSITQILRMLHQGETLYIDDHTCKPLKPKKEDMVSPLPTLKDVIKQQNKLKNAFSLNF